MNSGVGPLSYRPTPKRHNAVRPRPRSSLYGVYIEVIIEKFPHGCMTSRQQGKQKGISGQVITGAEASSVWVIAALGVVI